MNHGIPYFSTFSTPRTGVLGRQSDTSVRILLFFTLTSFIKVGIKFFVIYFSVLRHVLIYGLLNTSVINEIRFLKSPPLSRLPTRPVSRDINFLPLGTTRTSYVRA